MCFVCVVTLACCMMMMMMQKEGTLERSKTKEKDCCEIRDSDEELEVVHGEPNHHIGE